MSDPTIPQPRDEVNGAQPDAVEPQPPVSALATPAVPVSTVAAAEAPAPIEDEPVADEPVADESVESQPTEASDTEASDDEASDTEAGDTEAGDDEATDAAAEPESGSDVTVAEPVASFAAPQPPRGIWTDEQAEALRTKVRDATAKAVDRAAGVVIDTVNNLASAIRARAAERRGDGNRR